jgi:chaperonin GroES
MSNIKAVNNFLFVLRDKEESEKAGILIPGSSREKPHEGTVVSVGDLVQDQNIKKAKGKKVLFFKGVGFTIEFEKVEYLVLSADQIVAILHEGTKR